MQYGMEKTLTQFIFSMKDRLMLFDLLNEEEVERIIPYLEVVHYPKGTVIFKEGEPGDSIGFIAAGKVEVKKQTEFEGKEIVLAILEECSFTGEMSLINDVEPRSTTEVALEDTEMVVLRRESLESVIQKYPHIGIMILKGLNQILTIRLRKNMERLTSVF